MEAVAKVSLSQFPNYRRKGLVMVNEGARVHRLGMQMLYGSSAIIEGNESLKIFDYNDIYEGGDPIITMQHLNGQILIM